MLSPKVKDFFQLDFNQNQGLFFKNFKIQNMNALKFINNFDTLYYRYLSFLFDCGKNY